MEITSTHKKEKAIKILTRFIREDFVVLPGLIGQTRQGLSVGFLPTGSQH